MTSKDYFVNVRFPPRLFDELHSVQTKSPSEIVRESVATWLQYYKMDMKQTELRPDENYTIIGKTRCGKTMLVQAMLSKIKKQIIIIDVHREYNEFGVVKEIRHFAELPLGEESTAVVNKVWCQEKARALVKMIKKSKENVVIQPEFNDLAMEQLFIDELLKTLLQDHIIGDRKQELLLVEEANRYQDSLFPIVSQGLKTGLQTILISQFPLPSKIMLNTTIILGHMWSNMLEKTDLPKDIIDTCKFLKLYEWVWFDIKGNSWRKWVSYKPDNATEAATAASPADSAGK